MKFAALTVQLAMNSVDQDQLLVLKMSVQLEYGRLVHPNSLHRTAEAR